MAGQDEGPRAELPTNWSTASSGERNVPVVFVAPPSSHMESSTTRGVTGLVVLAVTAISVMIGAYFSYQNWSPEGYLSKLEDAQNISAEADAIGLENYRERLIEQNTLLCETRVRPEIQRRDLPPEPPINDLQAQIGGARNVYATLCDSSRVGRDTLNCSRTQVPPLETQRARADICSRYTVRQ